MRLIKTKRCLRFPCRFKRVQYSIKLSLNQSNVQIIKINGQKHSIDWDQTSAAENFAVMC